MGGAVPQRPVQVRRRVPARRPAPVRVPVLLPAFPSSPCSSSCIGSHACTWATCTRGTAARQSAAAKLDAMPPKAQETWRSRFSGSADRRGIPLGTIVVSVATIILLLDLNAALILGLWVLRTILVYVVVAFFITLLLTPATRFLRRRGLSHGGATLLVFLIGVLVLGGLVYLFAEPLVTAAINFGKEVPRPGQPRPRRATARSDAWSTGCIYRSTCRRIRRSSPRRSPRC